MTEAKRLIVSHAPFWHSGASVGQRQRHLILATMPALLFGIGQYGARALGVVCLAASTAMLWELAMNRATGRRITIGDGNAALIGLLLAMLLPATAPWWLVIMGTFLAVIIGKQIYGGIGSNAFNPVAVSLAILSLSWNRVIDFNSALLAYDMSFPMYYPLAALKHHGPAAVAQLDAFDLLLGRQPGGIGAVFGLGLIAGGIYLMARGFIRWEICLSVLLGIVLTAWLFHMAAPERFAGPALHLVSGYTLVAVFFLFPEDSSSPVNLVPMLIYGFGGGLLTVLIRNLGSYADGVLYAVLVMNMLNPLLDKIRPQPLGKVS
jgi:electron transport complex protein RnfD